MKNFGIHEFDSRLRRIFSVLFRLIIVAFAAFVVWTSNNFFPDSYYAIGCIFYFILYYFFLQQEKYSKPRLFFDYCLIFFIIYGKDSSNLAALLIILLPVINSPNHSGRSSSPFLVLFLTFILFVYLIRDSKIFTYGTLYVIVYIAIPFILFSIIVMFEFLRTKLIRLNDYFNKAIDEYYQNNMQFAEKPHKILRTINDLINNSRLIWFKTEKLICIRIVNGKMSIVGGTSFVFRYDIENRSSYLEQLRHKPFVKNWSIRIDKELSQNNISYLIKTPDVEYIFLLVSRTAPNSFSGFLMMPVFSRMVKILTFENSLSAQRNHYMEKLKNRMEFIEDAQVAMHFIKNKLSPIKNFISISEDLDNLPPESREEAFKHFQKERDKIKSNIPIILDKAQRFHGNVDKPFSLSDFKVEKAKKLVAIVRNSWNTWFSDDDIHTEIDTEQIDRYSVELNEDLLEYLLTNWISNIDRHGGKHKRLLFSETDEYLVVSFENGIKPTHMKEAEDFVHDFNSDDRNEIINRGGQSRGLRELKWFVRGLDIQNSMNITNSIIHFSLTFKKIK